MWHLVTPKQRSLHHIIQLYRSYTTDFSLATRAPRSRWRNASTYHKCDFFDYIVNMKNSAITSADDGFMFKDDHLCNKDNHNWELLEHFYPHAEGQGCHSETMHILPLCSGTKRHSVESRYATRSLAEHLQMVVRILGSFTRADMLILCSQSARQWSFVFEQKRLNINTHGTKTEKVEHGAETFTGVSKDISFLYVRPKLFALEHIVARSHWLI